MWIFILEWVPLVFGALLIIRPQNLIRLNQVLNRMITTIDRGSSEYRMGVGIRLIGAGKFPFLPII